MTVEVYEVRGGKVLDTVTVDRSGRLRFATGLGRGVFDRLRRRLPDASPAELLEAGWSNGYLATRTAQGSVSAFSPDQPRAPRGTPIGGQWLDTLRSIADLLDIVDQINSVDPFDEDDIEDERFGHFDEEGEFIPDRPRRPDTPQVDRQELTAEVESAADDIFRGSFGGLSTDVRIVDTDNGLSVAGVVLDGDGREVGRFERGFYHDGSNRLVARHEILEIEPRVQGSGFAAAFNAHLERWYEQSGVHYVSLNANIDVGGYAWARAGYEFADHEGYGKVMFRLYGAAQGYSGAAERATDPQEAARLRVQADAAWALLERAGIPQDDLEWDFGRDFDEERWDHPDAPTPYEVSQVGRPDGGGRGVQWLGKDVLLGSSWEGVRWL